MISLSQRLDQYLALRRSFGFDLAFPERVLRKFTAFADDRGDRHITTDLFLTWKAAYGSASNATWANRLSMVRGFSRWLAEHDALTHVLPAELIPGRKHTRPAPYIYTREEIGSLVAAAAALPSVYGLRSAVWQTVFGLIAVTGLRINEALNIDRKHVDLDRGFLQVEKSKNGTGRLIPIHESTTERLTSYAAVRDRILGPTDGRFFLKENGTPAGDCGARYNFAEISRVVGLRGPQLYQRHGTGPRIHDLRHTFAVRTILGWFREGREIDREMYKLSAYLGHVQPEYTYWYIEAVPELMQLAADRAERRYRGYAS
ncbi:phage integrase family protein [Roseivivax marinus]|uniref:Phage integrase family protein n=1 Tax=Roseivivax marinus TaxID=1379903 RepID=W4HFI7_9RHOB|nr:tyrosine-type recombinase/integrase [Roseivivax marinus]ETW10760.1 phage integrase family protein [Roseivivax marinus]